MIFEPDGQDTGRDCMRKAVILCVVFSSAAILAACAGNSGNINKTGDAGAMTENVL